MFWEVKPAHYYNKNLYSDSDGKQSNIGEMDE